jgi:hypothetical protein
VTWSFAISTHRDLTWNHADVGFGLVDHTREKFLHQVQLVLPDNQINQKKRTFFAYRQTLNSSRRRWMQAKRVESA